MRFNTLISQCEEKKQLRWGTIAAHNWDAMDTDIQGKIKQQQQ